MKYIYYLKSIYLKLLKLIQYQKNIMKKTKNTLKNVLKGIVRKTKNALKNIIKYIMRKTRNKLKTIWNRILQNLPILYKTKGTEECVRLLANIYGIPHNLLKVARNQLNYTRDPIMSVL